MYKKRVNELCVRNIRMLLLCQAWIALQSTHTNNNEVAGAPALDITRFQRHCPAVPESLEALTAV